MGDEGKVALEAREAQNRQARMEEADTFRGVHLNPNAHHWDEVRSAVFTQAPYSPFLDGGGR